MQFRKHGRPGARRRDAGKRETHQQAGARADDEHGEHGVARSRAALRIQAVGPRARVEEVRHAEEEARCEDVRRLAHESGRVRVVLLEVVTVVVSGQWLVRPEVMLPPMRCIQISAGRIFRNKQTTYRRA